MATIYSLGRRVGNWWTASSGDEEFLHLLDEDELNLLTRRGVLDAARFNKTWNNCMTLLANGKKMTIEGEQAHKVLGQLSRFTACMVCIIASLDAFAEFTVVRTILRKLLLELLKTTEHGEDLLASELSNRINAWRSAACIRGIHKQVREIRLSLVKSKRILSGTIPLRDTKEVVDFLYWLLTENTTQFYTSCSDLAGIAHCLSQTGFDLLSVDGLGYPTETSCRLVYDVSQALKPQNHLAHQEDWFVNNPRGLCTTVSLVHPEESMSVFPISQDVAYRCRYAWKRGCHAAKAVRLHLTKKESDDELINSELRYAAVDRGEIYDRVDDGIFQLASAFGFVLNKELCDALQQVLGDEPAGIADWLLEQTASTKSENSLNALKSPIQASAENINAFTVFQAFFMGYYYDVCLCLVDTSKLELQIVDGAWGFRSLQFLVDMRAHGAKAARTKEGIPRRVMFELLCSMLCSKRVTVENVGRGRDCIGIVGKRTLLCNSLLNPCSRPDEVGQFVLLDIDVGSIPSDIHGLIRPGVPQQPHPTTLARSSMASMIETGPDKDCTRHIEADWDINPETALLCIRYKGRRLASLNVAEADAAFCWRYVKPVQEPCTSKASHDLPVSVDINDLINGTLPDPSSRPVFIQAYGAPCLIYTFAAIYQHWPMAIASNCIHTAWQQAARNKESTIYFRHNDVRPVVIARAGPEKDITYMLVENDEDVEQLKPFAGLLKETLGPSKVKEIEEYLKASSKSR